MLGRVTFQIQSAGRAHYHVSSPVSLLMRCLKPREAQNSAEQKAPPALAAGPQPSELATTSTAQRPTSAAVLAEAPAVKDAPSAQTFNDTVAVAPESRAGSEAAK